MSKFKVGDKVRILDVDSIMYGREYLSNGQLSNVVRVDNDGGIRITTSKSSTGRFLLTTNEFHAIELVEDSGDKHHDLSEEIAELKRRVAKLEGSLAEENPEPSTNERRKEAIEKAKKFVKVESDDGYHYYLLRPRFIINEEKRTVVCLLERYDHGYIHRKGIAKCAPSDVFNVHIGKAIALGRAYGLDVSEFEQAPQPDEVVVGMNTTNRLNVESVYKVTEVSTTEVWRENGLYLEHRDVIILSDTEAQY